MEMNLVCKSIFALLAFYILYSECIKLPEIVKKNKTLFYFLIGGLYLYMYQNDQVDQVEGLGGHWFESRLSALNTVKRIAVGALVVCGVFLAGVPLVLDRTKISLSKPLGDAMLVVGVGMIAQGVSIFINNNKTLGWWILTFFLLVAFLNVHPSHLLDEGGSPLLFMCVLAGLAVSIFFGGPPGFLFSIS